MLLYVVIGIIRDCRFKVAKVSGVIITFAIIIMCGVRESGLTFILKQSKDLLITIRPNRLPIKFLFWYVAMCTLHCSLYYAMSTLLPFYGYRINILLVSDRQIVTIIIRIIHLYVCYVHKYVIATNYNTLNIDALFGS